jgi:isoquinoline 1-oxidoreductase beta subunit
VTASRRLFLAGGAATGLLVAFRVDPRAEADAPATSSVFEPNAFLRIAPDDTVTVYVVRLEMGQGVRTLLPMIVAEELEAEWSRVHVEQAWPGGRFAGIRLHTSGSSSSSEMYAALRTAGAAAREMLVRAAAETWDVPVGSCRAENGAVVHDASGRRARYGRLAVAAARQAVPEHPTLKPVSRFSRLGHPTRRVDGPDIVTGRALYGSDVRVPGMLHATILRAPTFGGRLVRFDDTAARQVPGVRRVLAVRSGIHPGVAVVATDTWAALRGREVLKVEWDRGPRSASAFDSDLYLAGLEQAFSRASFKVRHEGDAHAALAAAPRRHEATYVFPFQAHAPLETMNATARVDADGAELWVPTQTDVRTLAQAAKVSGLPAEKIRLHCCLMGGGFGRRLFADYAAEAVEVSKAVGAPVQVTWTREDETRHGYFQPATAQRFTAGLDAADRLVALVHETTSSDLTIYDIHDGRDIWAGPPPAPKAADAYEADQSPWGAYDNPYEIPHLRVDCADVTSPVPTGPWRAVEYPSTVFGRESFLDELAHLAGRDPLEYRLDLLPAGVKKVGPYAIDRGRLARALRTVAARAGWDGPLPRSAGRRWGRGIAANVYHAGSYVAMVAEVSVAEDLSDVRVHRVVTAIDCGIPLNPLGLQGQTESGVTWGLTATLLGKVDFRGGAAVQTGYGDYEVLRIDRMPRVETHVLQSGAKPGGFGEHPVPTVAPAVAGAVFAAVGRRVRQLPITPAALRRA